MTYPQMDPRRLDLSGSFGLRVAGRDAAEVRIGTAGRWGQRVNLATNPSFETTAGTVVVRTNLATSPRSYTPATSGPHPGLGAGPYTGSAEIDGVRQAVDPLALVGGTTYVRLLIESGTVPLGDYFDGDESPDPDLTPKWTGAVNASTSVLRGAAVSATVSVTANSRSIASTRWAASGQHSVRNIPSATSVETNIQVGGGDATAAGLGVLQPDRTYRIGATVHLDTPQTGALGSNPRTIRVSSNRVTGWTGATSAFSTSAPNVPGDHSVTLTVTIPSGTVWTMLYLRNGASAGNGDVWWDNLIIEDVTDLAAQWAALPDPKPTLADWLDERLGGYFDGDTESTRAALHHWTATPHASTSVQTLAWTPGD